MKALELPSIAALLTAASVLFAEASPADSTRAATQRVPERAAGAELVDYRGCLMNVFDSRGWPVWTPSLPGVLALNEGARVWDEWVALLRHCGATHIPIGGFDGAGGPAYHSADGARTPPDIDNPDWRQSPERVRALVEKLLDTPSADGKAFRPVIFLSGGALSREQIDREWPVLARALEGLQDNVIYVPGWEPVEGQARSRELSYALERGKALFGPRSHWFVHLSPGRWDGASHPAEPDDPWQGNGDAFYQSHGGQFVEGLLYQTEHGRAITDPCRPAVPGDQAGGNGAGVDRRRGQHPSDCWLTNFRRALDHLRVAGRRIVLFETNAFEVFRGRSNHEIALRIASDARVLCQQRGITCGFGSGMP